jgi:hypothetical protein
MSAIATTKIRKKEVDMKEVDEENVEWKRPCVCPPNAVQAPLDLERNGKSQFLIQPATPKGRYCVSLVVQTRFK